MKSCILILLILFVCNSYSFSQAKLFGNFSDEEWALKKCPFDTSSHAMILFDIGNVSIQRVVDITNYNAECPLAMDAFEMVTTRHLRIKIFDTTDLIANELVLKLNKKGKTEDKLSDFKGITAWNLNGKFYKTKFDSKNLSKVSEEVDNVKMLSNSPDLKNGCIVDFKYTITSKLFDKFPSWYFYSSIPIAYSEYKSSIPDFMDYKKSCKILDSLSFQSYLSPITISIWFSLTDGNKYFKDYKFNNVNESYYCKNKKAVLNPEIQGCLSYNLETNNIQQVYGKKTTFTLYSH